MRRKYEFHYTIWILLMVLIMIVFLSGCIKDLQKKFSKDPKLLYFGITDVQRTDSTKVFFTIVVNKHTKQAKIEVIPIIDGEEKFDSTWYKFFDLSDKEAKSHIAISYGFITAYDGEYFIRLTAIKGLERYTYHTQIDTRTL